jgi:hypothetical protein
MPRTEDGRELKLYCFFGWPEIQYVLSRVLKKEEKKVTVLSFKKRVAAGFENA